MFENLSDRIAGGLLVGIDLAVEFATLGEYRVVDPDLAPIPEPVEAGATSRRRIIELDDVDFTLLPKPSTALARATAPAGAAVATPSVVVAALCEQRRRGPAPKPSERPPQRKRGGAVQPAAQLCLPVD